MIIPLIVRLHLPKYKPTVPGGIGPFMPDFNIEELDQYYDYCLRAKVKRCKFQQQQIAANLLITALLTLFREGNHIREKPLLLWGLRLAPCPFSQDWTIRI